MFFCWWFFLHNFWSEFLGEPATQILKKKPPFVCGGFEKKMDQASWSYFLYGHHFEDLNVPAMSFWAYDTQTQGFRRKISHDPE